VGVTGETLVRLLCAGLLVIVVFLFVGLVYRGGWEFVVFFQFLFSKNP
jgi:hypothetical protein